MYRYRVVVARNERSRRASLGSRPDLSCLRRPRLHVVIQISIHRRRRIRRRGGSVRALPSEVPLLFAQAARRVSRQRALARKVSNLPAISALILIPSGATSFTLRSFIRHRAILRPMP